jgi:hypothetical protein
LSAVLSEVVDPIYCILGVKKPGELVWRRSWGWLTHSNNRDEKGYLEGFRTPRS